PVLGRSRVDRRTRGRGKGADQFSHQPSGQSSLPGKGDGAGLMSGRFNRERQRLTLTDAGRDYLAVVRDALDRIALGTERLVRRQTSGVLTVSTSPDFAAKWLVYRLGRVAESPPEIDLRMSASACRFRARGRRPRGAPRRWQMVRARCDAPLLR